MSPFNKNMDKNSRSLEINVLSCEDLRIGRRSVKKNTYVVVRTSSNWRSTTMDTVGGSYPSWGQVLDLDMPLHESYVTLEVHCKAASSGDRVIGSARMPATDFIGGYLPEEYLNFLSYRLVDPSGHRNGIVNVSVKVKGSIGTATSDSKQKKVVESKEGCSSVAKKPRDGGEKNLGGVVTGIPVVWHRSS